MSQVRIASARKWSWLDIEKEVITILDEVLSLKGRAAALTLDSRLLHTAPELDPLAIIASLALLEERLGFNVDESELDGAVFATVGSLVAYVCTRLDVSSGQHDAP
ncbi:MAG: acyl carrier protein [Candidatus Accumulibacter sp.]|uniref:acyl carrier protein n=1 Tax=Accumulibacter sp. TaxID=2053492 RepID=UPI00258BAA4B|nr:acyl carrier protein [Accumulibacter sp.]MCM8621359.1 acyl carrier protein [Accumulibacter sp.]